MSLLNRASHRGKAFLFLFAALALTGALAALRLPVALFPQVDFPRVVVSIDAGDRPADQMLTDVTIPVEESLRAVPGVKHIKSKTSRGSAEVSLDFAWGDDMTNGRLLVESAMSQATPDLPPGTRFLVRRMDPTVFPVVAISLVSDGEPLTRLWERAYFDIRPELLSIDGVARVEIIGGSREELQVVIDPDELDAAGLSINDVNRQIAQWTTIQAVGRIEDYYKLDLVLTSPQVTDSDSLRDLVLTADAAHVVRLGDVASIASAPEPRWTRVTADGHKAVLIQVYQQPSANTVAISGEVQKQLKRIGSSLPEQDTLSVWYDQSDLIKSSAVSLRDAVILGTLLAGLVLLLFLRSFKLTLIAVIVVPSVLASACLLLLVLGQSLNIMTLGGMAAAVGLIIDDAIVVMEHIIAKMRAGWESGGKTFSQRVLSAAGEFSRPLLGASLATIIIHLPPVFLTGVTGEFFKALSLTMALSLIISFFVAWLAIPLLSGRLLSVKQAESEDAGPIFGVIQKGFMLALRGLIKVRWAVPVLCLLWALVGWRAFSGIPSGFMPAMDEGGFVLDYVAEPGTSLTQTDRMVQEVEAILQETPEVETYSRRTGVQLGGGLTEANEGDFFVRLKPYPRRGIEDIMAEVRAKIHQRVPGLDVELLQLMEDLIGDLTAVPQPIEVKLSAQDPSILDAEAVRVAAQLEQLPGVVDVNNGLAIAGDALEVHIDPQKAALYGIDPGDATTQLRTLLAGEKVGAIIRQPKSIAIRVWSHEDDRSIEQDVGALRLTTPRGTTVRLSEIAEIDHISGQPTISRENLRETVSVTARTEGTDLGTAIRKVKTQLDKSGSLSPGVSYTLGGLYGEQQRAFTALLWVFVAAIGLLLLLVLFMYGSLRVAFILTGACLLTIPAVALGLRLTGTVLNISAMMGFAMIVGAAAEIGVFYCSEVFTRREQGEGDREALLSAAASRLRPITMTSLAAILALAPIALGIGEGAAMLQPLAIGIISGLVVQVPIVLGVVPALLAIGTRAGQGGQDASAQAG